MRREYTDYKKNMNIDFKLARLENYPLVWRDSLRMFFVLKGSIIVGIENEEFTIEEDSIEIINKNEPYYIKTEDKDNLVLIIDIRPEFFKKFNDFAEYIHYYTDTLDGFRQKEYKYRKLREYIAMLLYEFLERKEGYQENMEEVLLKTMNHLLNNFHYLVYEEESLREDDIQLERFTRIIYYLKQNYAQKVSLKEIAEREFLTPQYLSYKIKDTFGQSFNDFLNKIRVEESRKLLLDSEKSISDIALETGFSHSRYYNKHFLKIHGISPSDYREKYRLDDEELEREKKLDYLDPKTTSQYLEKYLAKYKRYREEDQVEKKHIELDAKTLANWSFKPVLDLQALDLFDSRNIQALGQVLEDLKIQDLIVKDRTQLEKSLSYYQVQGLNFLTREEASLREDLARGEDFFRDRTRLGGLFQAQNQGLSPWLGLIDKPGGPRGLLSQDYLKEPIYFGLEIYSKLGPDIIYQDSGALGTKSLDGFEILLWNQEDLGKKVSINLHGIRGAYSYIIYSYRRERTSIYSRMADLGGYDNINPIFLEDMKKLGLETSYGLIENSNIYNFVFNLDQDDLILIVLR